VLTLNSDITTEKRHVTLPPPDMPTGRTLIGPRRRPSTKVPCPSAGLPSPCLAGPLASPVVIPSINPGVGVAYWRAWAR